MPIDSAPQRRELSFLLVASALTLTLWTLLRVALWLIAGPADIGLPAAVQVFARGAWFDLATLAWLLAPLMLLSAVLPDRLRASRFMSRLRWGVLWLMTLLLLFGAVSEAVFWEEFSTRFNFIAVDYLIYTQEVIGNIMQSYPVGMHVGGMRSSLRSACTLCCCAVWSPSKAHRAA
jgi:hypothetical protein